MKKILVVFLVVMMILALGVSRAAFADDSASTLEQTSRAKIVDYMRAVASIEWTPSVDIPYWSKSQGFTFKAGEIYYGVPYTQAGRDHDLDSFRTQLKVVDGVAQYVGPSESSTYWGTDCSSTVSHAWRQVDPKFPTLSTDMMFPEANKRIVAVGDYRLVSKRSTAEITKENGYEVMASSYALLKPGDAVLYRESSGHVMLVLKNEPEKSRLFIADQTGCSNGVPKGRDGHSTLRVDYEFTYKTLFEKDYIPIRLKALEETSER